MLPYFRSSFRILMSPDLVTNSLLRIFGRSVSFRLWLFQIPPAMKNTSGSSKYLWLWKIPLACPNTSGFEEFLMLISPTFSSYEHSSYFKYLQLWMTPAISNTSGYEKYLQLLITWESTFFLVESCLKGLVHSGSSCRSWTYAAATMRNLNLAGW